MPWRRAVATTRGLNTAVRFNVCQLDCDLGACVLAALTHKHGAFVPEKCALARLENAQRDSERPEAPPNVEGEAGLPRAAISILLPHPPNSRA